MNAKNLMIDDWVLAKSSRGEKYYVTQVKNIYKGDADLPNGSIMDSTGHISSCDDIKPIPLTLDMLQNNSYVIEDDLATCYIYNNDEDVYFYYDKQYDFYYIEPKSYLNFQFNNVNEFQHLLRSMQKQDLADKIIIKQYGTGKDRKTDRAGF